MSYSQKLAEAQQAPARVIIDRHGAPKVTGSVVSIDETGATIKSENDVEVYIEFASMRGISIAGWDMEVLSGS